MIIGVDHGYSAMKTAHICFPSGIVRYAYCGDLAFTGCPYENLVNAGVIAYINHLFGMEEPPKGELSFSNANVTAVREGDIQKTPDITLNGDHRNKITIPVPQGVTGYNKSKGTNVSGGNLEVYGGDTFYLQAPLRQGACRWL